LLFVRLGISDTIVSGDSSYPIHEIFSCFFRAFNKKKSGIAFSYAKPNKQVRVFVVTSFDGYEPEGREFESLRAHLWYPNKRSRTL